MIRSSLLSFFLLKAIHFLYQLFKNQPIFSCNRLCIYLNTWVIFLQIFAIKCAEKLFSFQRFQKVCVSGNTSANFVWAFPRWRPFAEFGVFCSYRQDQLPHQVSLVKRFGFDFLIILSAHSSFIRLDTDESVQPMPSQVFQLILHQHSIILSC